MIGTVLLGPALVSPAVGSEGGSGDGEDVTFTVGVLNEVDSFNPFNGVEAASFEMWALSYDMLVGYSM